MSRTDATILSDDVERNICFFGSKQSSDDRHVVTRTSLKNVPGSKHSSDDRHARSSLDSSYSSDDRDDPKK